MTADEIRAAIAADPALQSLMPDSQAIAEALGLTDLEIWSPGMLARHYGVI